MADKQISFSSNYTSAIMNTTCTCTKRQFTKIQLAVIMIGSIFGLIIIYLIAVVMLKIFLKNFKEFAADKWKLVTCKEHKHCKVGYHESLASKLERLQSMSKQTFQEFKKTKTEALRERSRALKFLSHLMPPSLSYEVTIGGTPQPEYNENVTIYFNELVGLTLVMDKEKSMEIIESLDALFETYDHILQHYDVVPLHRVGSSLLLASGVPYVQKEHVSEIAQAALQIRQVVSICGGDLQLRAGMHSGSVMSGIVGKKVPQFGVMGDTVNTASRMSSTSIIGEIQVSEATRNLLVAFPNFKLTGGKERIIKGKGKMKTWWLNGYKGYDGELPIEHRLDRNLLKMPMPSPSPSSSRKSAQ